MMYETHIEAQKIEMLYEGDNAECMLRIVHVPSGVVKIDNTFSNARMLSANLRDILGYRPALNLIDYWGFSPNCDLYDLNHQRPYDPIPEMARNVDELVVDKTVLPSSDWIQIDSSGWTTFHEGASFALFENTKTRQLGLLTVSCCLYGDEESFTTEYRYSWWKNLCEANKNTCTDDHGSL